MLQRFLHLDRARLLSTSCENLGKFTDLRRISGIPRKSVKVLRKYRRNGNDRPVAKSQLLVFNADLFPECLQNKIKNTKLSFNPANVDFGVVQLGANLRGLDFQK